MRAVAVLVVLLTGTYLWARDGLLYSLHVSLTDGVTRETADAMAASIR